MRKKEKSRLFTPVPWHAIPNLVNLEGFLDNAYEIRDVPGIARYGCGSYFVNVQWLLDAARKREENG